MELTLHLRGFKVMYLAGGCQFCTSRDHQRRDCKAAKTKSQPFPGRGSRAGTTKMFRQKLSVEFHTSYLLPVTMLATT